MSNTNLFGFVSDSLGRLAVESKRMARESMHGQRVSAWPESQCMARESVHGQRVSAWPERQCTARESVHGQRVSAWPESQYMARESVHGQRVSTWPESQCMARDSVYGQRVSSWPESQCMARESVHGQRVSAWPESQCMARESVHGQRVSAWPESQCMASLNKIVYPWITPKTRTNWTFLFLIALPRKMVETSSSSMTDRPNVCPYPCNYNNWYIVYSNNNNQLWITLLANWTYPKWHTVAFVPTL